ncbi:succinate dehydrogenase, hydrophobic membrane anchor protein [Massilia sp. Dwa41.01b]|uniref:succinate dehydrogenase, hydrophobic membrane anchor protein n=1 Tax=unclassified Massilia TaxID=2609279 RepID=UPI001603EC7F|nr:MULTISPECIES: succinate dehydrogenase, hydrophobic membrane anchor protein [unclassified Massilia]QNA89839.1 succinate dehydrogenase, hydrophobic membrane anchor protein [Massilia sp. Dwa41.01b]QNB00731.1 succinate dehydrogenase, hydrophobic membrane anchor protein [Massilia sp. Se16.2.3]
MATKNNIGPRRLVVGAHYGVRDWLAQRVTAILMAVFTLVLLGTFLSAQNFSYEGWASLFARQWFKLFALVTFLGLYYHVWVGIRDIWMDYVKPAGIKLVLQFATVLWLLACAAWTVQILWSV